MNFACLVVMLLAGAPANVPERVLSVGGEVKAPRVLTRVNPNYELCIRKGKRIGRPLVEMIVGVDGSVREPRLLKRLNPCAEKATLDAVRRWRFTPATYRGKRVAVRYRITVTVHYE
jgi:periplasmic protein TonB